MKTQTKIPERPKKLQRPPTAFGALSKCERDAARRRPERKYIFNKCPKNVDFCKI
jgi:hypothetical protein